MTANTLTEALAACIVEADLAGSAHTLPMVDAHCQKIRAIAQDALAAAEQQESTDKRDAGRFRKLMAILQAAYDTDAEAAVAQLDELESIYCTMLSGWRNTRVVKAEITWRDTRDADLDLGSVLDAINVGV